MFFGLFFQLVKAMSERTFAKKIEILAATLL